VIVADDENVGRLYVCRWPEELRLLDIALLPPRRNQGIGTRLIRDLLTEAGERGTPVTLFVEAHNPARRLYDRLGFVVVAPGEVYDRLEWRPKGNNEEEIP
jgi:ribosomal protein S18 acetylase RimI-like enzyme